MTSQSFQDSLVSPQKIQEKHYYHFCKEKMTRPTRWSPTLEQLMFLEEMYRKVLRNPNDTQIQSITTICLLLG